MEWWSFYKTYITNWSNVLLIHLFHGSTVFLQLLMQWQGEITVLIQGKGVIDCFSFFGHDVFPALRSNWVENAPCDVTREILLNIIHTHQFKIRQKQPSNLFSPSVILFLTKFHVLVIMSKATSEVFSSYQRNRTVPSFREWYRSYSFVSTELWLWWHKDGFHWVRLNLLRQEQNDVFLYLSSNWFLDSRHNWISNNTYS